MSASKKMTSQDLLKLLQGGASYGEGADPRVLLATLLKNPSALQALRQRAEEEVSPYMQFDPTQVYDPSTNVNDVLFEYVSTRPQIAPIAKRYFEEYEAAGGNQGAINAANQFLQSQLSDVDEITRENIRAQLEKDAPRYLTAESSRAKKQMSAFYQQRKKAGLTGTPGKSDIGAYLESQTGLTGLGSLPTSIEEVAKQRGAQFGEKLKGRGKSQQAIAEMVSTFEKKFAEKAKKEKIAPAAFAPRDVIAKLLGGL